MASSFNISKQAAESVKVSYFCNRSRLARFEAWKAEAFRPRTLCDRLERSRTAMFNNVWEVFKMRRFG